MEALPGHEWPRPFEGEAWLIVQFGVMLLSLQTHISFHSPKVKKSESLVTQLCLTLCDPMSVHRIFQARVLGWLPSPPPGDLPHPGIKPGSPALQAGSISTEPRG